MCDNHSALSWVDCGGEGEETAQKALGCSHSISLDTRSSSLHLLTPPFLSLIGLFSVWRGAAPSAAQSVEKASFIRLLIIHAGDGAISTRRRRLYSEKPLSREQPRPHRGHHCTTASCGYAGGTGQPSEQALSPECVQITAAADVSQANEQKQLRSQETHSYQHIHWWTHRLCLNVHSWDLKCGVGHHRVSEITMLGPHICRWTTIHTQSSAAI